MLDWNNGARYTGAMKSYKYRIIIESDENNTFHSYVPALPGCHTWGETFAEARKNAKYAISAYIKVLIADKEKIPEDNGVEVIEIISFPNMKKKNLSYA